MFDTTYDDCWLRYERVDDSKLAPYRERLSHAYVSEGAPELGAVRAELRRGLEGMLGRELHLWQHPPRSVDSFLVIGHPEEMRPIHQTIDPDEVWDLHEDGYVIRTVEWEGHECTVVTAPSDRGLVYGTFHLLRRVALGEPIDDLDVVEEPANNSRIINHWDNPFRRSVERGYAGQSIFDWERLPDVRERYYDYARLLASVGINGVVPNNVNTGIPSRPTANDAVSERAGWQLLERDNLEKLEALASVFRRYGIRIYLSVNYAAPIKLGGLETADPHDSEVRQWWQDKVDEIYEIIPDFGGFLVKADSEGQPGPYDYDRSHAEGANVLGEAFEGHDGRVWWRAFVYSEHDDRAVQAYEAFEHIDGEFHDKVTVQIKNGPIDFQQREPVSTLFGAMPETNLGCELQLTGEYTGQGVHATSHIPMWKEVLEFDTYADGEGTPVKDVLAERDGQGIAGVGIVGEDPSWTGNHLLQSNLYGFARLCWDPDLESETIIEEWARQTFGRDEEVVDTVSEILLDSWQACIDYHTGGLGLMHMMYNGEEALENHYDPGPEEWPEYIGATADGIGVDRTSEGSGYAAQYRDPITERYDDPETCPEELLLFFHHLPWEYELEDGRTVIQTLYDNCYAGVEEVRELRAKWESLEGVVDERRHRHVAERFDEHVLQARRWRDRLCEYFYEHSGVPDEKGRVPQA
ncbi:alpha-glucuronidase family glycosyl hydrolase [Halopiger xanaduensis]|uniref:Alpha-glucuronidase n=1 Tax=Halopiger xanaduensis (strain DSM 18323 / JCM 14033 / SH-6) TaxID=797210 RepID=F8DCC1_HALXS|nr:alpha-glucuronidase family glycosyl hydrolase [Halopiger xanaduensis]AEH38378.1 Alpha-glucuronidase [Halopiger xanaduensis SH-6]